MENLFKDFKIEKTKITNQRQEVISFFVEEINKERPCYYKDKNGKKKKLGLITPRAVAIKLSILKTTQELREFLSECRDYKHRHKSFSKRFFGGFKEQKW
jgi:hypothetical protein